MKLTSHPIKFASLVDLVEGRLAADERAAAEAHVADCRRCTEQLAQLERTIGLMRADQSTDAPRDAVSYAVNLFRARRAARSDATSLVERIIATLSFDSARRAPAFGVRSGVPADSRQLMFTAGDNDIDIRLARTEEGWTISGQVLGNCAVGWVEIEGAGQEPRKMEAILNELCEFRLPPIPAGSYTLSLHLPGAEVQIPEIDLGA